MHIKLHTGYSFRHAFGSIPDVLDCVYPDKYAGICDRNGTWGHREWARECKNRGIKPLFGVELAVVSNMEKRQKQIVNWMSFIAINNYGLKEINELASLATEKFYYHPRIDIDVIKNISSNVVILSGDNILVLEPILKEMMQKTHFLFEHSNTFYNLESTANAPYVWVCNNYYPRTKDKSAYEIAVGETYQDYPFDMSITRPTGRQVEDEIGMLNDIIGNMCMVDLFDAEMVKPKLEQGLSEICYSLLYEKFDHLKDNQEYIDRLNHELTIINKKKFNDYFLVVHDLVKHAKETMLVGPARGSSCGSLVCFILGITTVDPIKFGLLFERFIDINREDYPDIDIDFPDTRRDEVFHYLRQKYGYDCVAKLGTLNYFKGKNSLIDTGRALKIPLHVFANLKDNLAESNEETLTASLKATFEMTAEGKAFIQKHPYMKVAQRIEGHPRHAGVHAAGIVITNKPLSFYTAIDERTQSIQMDKVEAEKIGMLKIDALGLRTLSVIQDTLDQIGMSKGELYNLNLDIPKVFDMINSHKFAGIFQFEGRTLLDITKKIRVSHFEDIAALTSLCRPGPMQCGGTEKYILCKSGSIKPNFYHPLYEEVTKFTYGVIVYQEQVMQIGRLIGKMTWGQISMLRKAISKSMGKFVFKDLFNSFEQGALENGLKPETIDSIWSNMQTMGMYAFNRSHAVAYAMISYWCMYLKAHHPLEYFCSSLRSAKDDDHTLIMLREISQEKIPYEIYNKNKSSLTWQVIDGCIIGGLMNIKGVGLKTAEEIIRKRKNGILLTERQEELVTKGSTPFDVLFETNKKWAHVFQNPRYYGVTGSLYFISDIKNHQKGSFRVLAKIINLKIKEIDSPENVDKRKGRVFGGFQRYVVATAQDDTDSMTIIIGRSVFEKIENNFIDSHADGDYYILLGDFTKEYSTLAVSKLLRITDNERFYPEMKNRLFEPLPMNPPFFEPVEEIDYKILDDLIDSSDDELLGKVTDE